MMRISLEKAFQAGENLGTPFELELAMPGVLQVETLLRVLPGKRLVMKAKHDNAVFLVKIFREKHSYRKELGGYDALSAANISTPKRLWHGELAEGAFCFYEFIEDLRSFRQVYEQASVKEKPQCLRELLALLGLMYQNNTFQEDLHFGNFAYAKERLLALDPASCNVRHGPGKIVDNLSLLLAQIPLQEWPVALDVISSVFPTIDKALLEKSGERRWKKRLAVFLEKIYRECTYVRHWKAKSMAAGQIHIRCVRQDCSAEMMAVLERIETPPANAVYLKRGESSLVYTMEAAGLEIAVKHAKNKSFGKLLSRCWRQSRASKAWYFSHLLIEAGIAVPKPVAMIERKFGPFVMESWFVSKYVTAETLYHLWHREQPDPARITQVQHVFKMLDFLKVSHGDLKATNFLVTDNSLLVIDYDGMKTHLCGHAAKKRQQQDKKRFFQNWPQQNISTLFE